LGPGRGRARAALRYLRRLAGAVMIGVATLFVPKSRRDQHWSEPPTAEVDPSESAVRGSGQRKR
jgi:hypothetical protein